MQGEASLPELEEWAAEQGEPERISGRVEALENEVNRYLYGIDLG
jgi:xylose isomerase